jgi:hypothetical protein
MITQVIKRSVLSLICVLLLAACSPVRPGPQAWIDSPFNGAVIPSGETVEIIGHTASLDGTTRIILYVNGTPEMNSSPEDPEADFVRVVFPWTPPENGDYTLQLRMMSGADETGGSEPVRVRVGRLALFVEPDLEEPQLEKPTGLPTGTEPPPGEEQPSPRYTATIYVTPTRTPEPRDTTPPPVPTPYVPADGLVIGCASTQNLVWLPVDDPSGLNGYYVRLEREVSPGSWEQDSQYGPINDKQVEVSIECGIYYRWSVRAEDNAGNLSSWSSWSTFAVELD